MALLVPLPNRHPGKRRRDLERLGPVAQRVELERRRSSRARVSGATYSVRTGAAVCLSETAKSESWGATARLGTQELGLCRLANGQVDLVA